MRHTTPASVCPSRPFASERGAGGGGGPVGRFTRNSSTYRAGRLPRVQHHQPGPTCLERAVVAAQQEAQHETYRILAPLLFDDTRRLLDGLLVADPRREGTALTWLRRAAVANSPRAILHNIEKIEFLKGTGVARWPWTA